MLPLIPVTPLTFSSMALNGMLEYILDVEIKLTPETISGCIVKDYSLYLFVWLLEI